ncbi:coiled-coil domain-containing protein 97 isoform X1 [Protopterus annectens]|uniref:coiled-coil domain-containing protein 97 isoform X1 n=1 Tax=Protopterus annectens TaxID=7888 RepID=UPI001CFC2725|nr:coiled-coil domain-containing protein 97 isoform X1 [Protopterus annectens]
MSRGKTTHSNFRAPNGNGDLDEIEDEDKESPMLDDGMCSSTLAPLVTLKTEDSLPNVISKDMNAPIQKMTVEDEEEQKETAEANEVAENKTILTGMSKCDSASSEIEIGLEKMFNAIANSNSYIKSQQKDEPDLTHQQKVDILKDLFIHRPVVFLERFKKVLQESHLICFSHLAGNYEVDFYCSEIRKSSLKKVSRTRVRNKRYAALQKLIKDGEYFSDEQMRSRDPLSYEQYIGQYLTDEEIMSQNSRDISSSCSLSGILMNTYQEAIVQQRMQTQQELEDACMEEEDEDEEDAVPDTEPEEWIPNEEEKTMLREEFVSRMHQCFLDGKDKNFDYSEIDDNPDYDNLDIVNRDEEERYFDDDGEDKEDYDDDCSGCAYNEHKEHELGSET